jgi:hypothetical protein
MARKLGGSLADAFTVVLSAFLILLLELSVHNMKSGVGGGNSRVDSRLQEDFFELTGFEFLGQPSANVESEFLPAA